MIYLKPLPSSHRLPQDEIIRRVKTATWLTRSLREHEEEEHDEQALKPKAGEKATYPNETNPNANRQS